MAVKDLQCSKKYRDLYSERELTFTFAICHRPSVCSLSVVLIKQLFKLLSIGAKVRPRYLQNFDL